MIWVHIDWEISSHDFMKLQTLKETIIIIIIRSYNKMVNQIDSRNLSHVLESYTSKRNDDVSDHESVQSEGTVAIQSNQSPAI